MPPTATTKAKLCLETGAEIEFMFNPSDLTVTKQNEWKPTPSAGHTTPKSSIFVSGAPAAMDLKLTIDTTDTGDAVTQHTDELQQLVEVQPKAADGVGRPPWVKLIWGEMVPYKFICTSLSVAFTYFASSGIPLRAKVTLKLQQFQDPAAPPKTNPTSGTPYPHRIHTVQSGETLDRISAEYYGNAGRWRTIADANPTIVTDPLDLRPGVRLVIPDRRTPTP